MKIGDTIILKIDYHGVKTGTEGIVYGIDIDGLWIDVKFKRHRPIETLLTNEYTLKENLV